MASPEEWIREELDLFELPDDYRARYNIAPTQDVLAVIRADDGLRAGWLRWGLIPFWARDPSIGNRMINARADSIASKPAFRDAFRRRRCLIVADGFYEW
ncbi:MAG: SOS response-associated peptidase family protein, partial [Gemmatimonadota bacterium]